MEWQLVANVSDIYGTVFIDLIIEEHFINNEEGWGWYTDDSWSISQNTNEEREIDE